MLRIVERKDAPVSKKTPYKIVKEGKIFGAISDFEDVDWFKIDYKKPRGWDYVFKASKDGTLNGLESGTISVYDKRTNLVASDHFQDGYSSYGNTAEMWIGSFTNKKKDKIGFISIESPGSDTGKYQIQVTRDVAQNEFTHAEVKIKKRYDGVLDYKDTGFFGGDGDWIAFTPKSDGSYYFRVGAKFSLTSTGSSFGVSNQDGEPISQGDGKTVAHINGKKGETVFVDFYNNEAADIGKDAYYFVEAFPDVAGGVETKKAAVLGKEIKGYFFPETIDEDSYRVTLEAGTEYSISYTSASEWHTSSGNKIRILDEDGNEIVEYEGAQKIDFNFTAEDGGIYYVAARGFDGDYDYKKDPDFFMTISAVGDIYGTNRKDVLKGTKFGESLFGFNGNDKILAGKGDDVLDGGGGKDRLIAGRGDDIIDGGKGKDVLVGKAGQDIFVFSDKKKRDIVRDFKDGEDRFDVAGMKRSSDIDVTKKGKHALVEVESIEFLVKRVDVADIDLSDFLI